MTNEVFTTADAEGASAIILAAGLSERLGVPKLSLLYGDGVSFVEHCARSFLDAGSRQVVLVVNRQGRHWMDRHALEFTGKVQTVVNNHNELGRFHSLELGLSAVDKKLPAFVHNVDNPFVNPEVLAELKAAYSRIFAGEQTIEGGKATEEGKATEDLYFSPVYGGRGGHPILLSPAVVRAILQKKQEPASLKAFLSDFRRFRVPVSDPNILVNINTMKDYRDCGLPVKVRQ